jgi:hypothetical protein
VTSLETETWVPPLDLYLGQRVAEFERRLQRNGLGDIITGACAGVAARLRRLRRRTRRTRLSASGPPKADTGAYKAWWTEQWAPEGAPTSERLQQDWEARWERTRGTLARSRQGHDKEPADWPEFSDHALRKHEGLDRAVSSLVTQLRTGKIGLRAFLFQRRVPDIPSPYCQCGERETPVHIWTSCPLYEQRRAGLPPATTSRDFQVAVTSTRRAGATAGWFLRTGRLGEYRLAVQLLQEDGRLGPSLAEDEGRAGDEDPDGERSDGDSGAEDDGVVRGPLQH